MATADRFTIDIIQNSLQAICEEMFAAMQKTAMSAIIYEVLDMGTAIVDEHGNLACAGIPLFIAGLDKCVCFIKEKCVKEGIEIKEGDIFVTNDPYYGGVTHLNDVIFSMPVFVDGEIVAWTSDIAHWNDVGGMVPGSMATYATEIFQEGLRLPAVKIIEAGQPNLSLIQTIGVNSRMPDYQEGDMWAGISAVRIGGRRIQEVVRKYSAPVFREALRDFLDYGEQVTLKALKRLPKGIYRHTEEQDSGLRYSCSITITDNRFIVDLSDNPPDPGPNNLSREAALLSAQLLVKTISDGSPVCNGGNFRPIEFITKKGTVFDAAPPAPQGYYYETVVQLYDLLWRCLAKHMPALLPAGHYASMCATVVGGIHPDTGRGYTIVEPQLGGWGGYKGGDGASAVFTCFHGLTYNCPAGVKITYRLRAQNAFLTFCFRRSKFAPWSLEGGLPGTTNYVEIVGEDGKIERLSTASGRPIKKGDRIRLVTGNGGGYGHPSRRPKEKVLEDIKNGYVTLERAREVYGFTEEEAIARQESPPQTEHVYK